MMTVFCSLFKIDLNSSALKTETAQNLKAFPLQEPSLCYHALLSFSMGFFHGASRLRVAEAQYLEYIRMAKLAVAARSAPKCNNLEDP